MQATHPEIWEPNCPGALHVSGLVNYEAGRKILVRGVVFVSIRWLGELMLVVAKRPLIECENEMARRERGLLALALAGATRNANRK
jgi:hypothetical protein